MQYVVYMWIDAVWTSTKISGSARLPSRRDCVALVLRPATRFGGIYSLRAGLRSHKVAKYLAFLPFHFRE